jgi:hypothetical protein
MPGGGQEGRLSFPARQTTQDECRSELLRLMGVPRFPGVYVLGCFAKYVTVYAQQVRALNLVDALARAGKLSSRSSVAVVGAGIAGLTAAAAAAVRGAEAVQVFESMVASMRLQRTSEKRYIHPHIYDWPEIPAAGSGDDGRANLPLMDWQAARASDVIAALDREWQKAFERVNGRLLAPVYNCGPVEVTVGQRGPVLRLSDGEPRYFDAVILAVGFGSDLNFGTDPYWDDNKIGTPGMETGKTWLVSGYGDGALTDLMRLCIRDFKHRDVIHSVGEQTRDTVGKELMHAERTCTTEKQLAEAYDAAAAKIAPDLEKVLHERKVGVIRLNCTKDKLFSPKSSVLNRLIVAFLLRKGWFGLYEGGEVVTPVAMVDGRYQVHFKDRPGPPLPVDEIILRHGPDRALEKGFPEIWKACERIRETWLSARQHEDWTKQPLYEAVDFGDRVPPLRVHFGDRIGCVVVTGNQQLFGSSQVQRLGQALARFQKRLDGGKVDGREIDPKPHPFSASDSLASSAEYERTVRALCEADVAAFDITGYEPAVLLFLGIRAAVRRGVTITLTAEPSVVLPFNLASLNPICMGPGDVEEITSAIGAGLSSLKARRGTYLDLPVFDAVRNLGEDYRPKQPKEQILLLGWFEKRYRGAVDDLIRTGLSGLFPVKSLSTTVDSRSPQLVDQRLYSDIRRTIVCVADWTGWRPNVFFEIGVRLAVSPIDPVFILCSEKPPGWTPGQDGKDVPWPADERTSTAALVEFFRPTAFTFNTPEALELRLRGIGDNGPPRVEEAMISPGRTYAVVLEALRLTDEPGGQTVHKSLTDDATLMAGPAQELGDVPVLFTEVLKEQVRRGALERTLAAWYYLVGRYQLATHIKKKTLATVDREIVRAVLRVGADVRDRLQSASVLEYKAVSKDVLNTLARLESLSE